MQVEPLKLLTHQDIDNIDAYIVDYANPDVSWKSRASVEYILRHWNEAKKEYLLPLFDNNLIIKKNVNYEASVDELMDEIEKLPIYKKVSNEYMEFCSAYYVQYNGYYGDRSSETFSDPDYPDLCRNSYEIRRLISSWCLAKNSYDDYNVKIEDKKRGQGHYIAIQNGCKPFRILQKINEAYHFTEDLEALRLAVSVVLNKKKIAGEVYLSIHPLDYMTMSDNSCHWSSCMSWQEQGCYRQGTVEMMNSRMVIVAYMTSSSDEFRFYDKTWNNKRWRSLYIVDPRFITSIKAYPYDNKSLDRIIVDELKHMCHEKLGWEYGQTITHDGSYFVEDDREYHLDLCCNEMYNDFGCCTHTGCIGTEAESKVYLNYSGYSECMWCGDSNDDGFDGGEASLVCSHCGDIKYCVDCGERIYNDEYYYDGDGNYICSNCRWEDYDIDMSSGELYNVNDMTDIYVIPKEFRDNPELKNIFKDYSCEHPYFRILCRGDWNYVSKVEFHKEDIENSYFHYTEPYYYMFDDEFVSDSKFYAFKNCWYDCGQQEWETCRDQLIETFLGKNEEIA